MAIHKPNFFIVGFPKCGTTSLASYLAAHPDILFSDPKEPNYFAPNVFPKPVTSEEEYLYCFADKNKDYKAIGDGSVTCIFSRHAVDKILDYSPGTKFIVVVRNPLDLVVSQHAEVLRAGREAIDDFEDAWRMSASRNDEQDLPINYREFGRVGTRLEWLLGKIQRDRLKIIVFDDMVRDMRTVYLEVLSFLGVTDDGRADFPVNRFGGIIAPNASRTLSTGRLVHC